MSTISSATIAAFLTLLTTLGIGGGTPQLSAISGAGSGLVAHYTFDEGSGTTAGDSAGSNTGTLVSNPLWTSGKIGGALDFNTGTTSHVNLGMFAPMKNAPAVSVSMWAKFDTLLSGDEFLIEDYTNSTSFTFKINRYREKITCEVRTSTNIKAIKNFTNDTGVWHLVTCVYDGSNITVYVDGVPGTPVAQTGNTMNASSNLIIGTNLSGSVGHNSLDDLRIYSRALSASEISELYAYTGSGGGSTPTNGVCGSSNNVCSSGSLSDTSDTSTLYQWQCLGSGGGTTASCSQTIPSQSDTQAPSTPTSLLATAVSSSQINLSWTASTDNVGVTGYRVYRNGTLLASPTSNSYSNTSLTASTNYSYTVSAYDAAGNSSSQSSSASATTQSAQASTYTLSVTKTGSGTGTVTSTSINCGSTCSQSNITSGTSITLTATPQSGSTFTGWSGGSCSGTGTCTTTVTANTTVTAGFSFQIISGSGDPELTNYKSGINLVWGVGDGSDKGSAYMEEYLYSDKIISDRKIVYIKDSTEITMSHNTYNNVANHISDGASDTTGPFGFFRVIGENGLDGVPNSGDEGIIRYRIDREGQNYAFAWTPYDATPFPAYTSPITFSGLEYSAGVPVVGTTGAGSGYQRGIMDSKGDEWHVIAVGDDDSAHEPLARIEQQGSDGKIYTFVVNPKAPAMSVRATGNAQFYTTPAKVYLVPKIHPQTTYITPGSGTVTFELRDIYNRNISYRINGGSWVNVGTNTITLSDSSFTTGSNTLEYRSAGFEGNAKTRTVVKNPTHPSLSESHGHYLWGNQSELSKITARLNRAPYLSNWNNVKSLKQTLLDEWDANGMTPHRNPFFTSSFLNRVPLPEPQQNTAFIGLVTGFNSTPSGKSKSWGQYAKEQMLNGIWTRIDPVEYERNQSNGANPSTEVIGAGYYQVGTLISTVIAYDILAGHYRSDQYSGGLTPIEDYFIRDVLATGVLQTNYTILDTGNHNGGANGASMGLWYGARSVGSIMVAQCLKEYSTPYYGTSGYGNAQTQYTYTPHPSFGPTWKTIYATTPAQSSTVPGTNLPAFTIEDPTLWQPGGVWGGPNMGYFDLMSRVFSILLNLNARYSPTTVYPYLNAGLQNGINGTLTTIAGQPGVYKEAPLLGNSYFGAMGVSAVNAVKAAGNESTSIRDRGLLGLIWYDDTLTTGSPSGLSINVTKSGTGLGTITGGSINCGTTCSQSNISSGTSITLTATPSQGSTFSGWSGGTCSGTGTCVISITANANITATFAMIPDTTPPTISITSPTGGTISGSVSLSASASDNVGVIGVQFKLDGTNLSSELTTAPYSGTWNTTGVSNGTHTLTAVARDLAGNTKTSSSVTITVSNTTPTTPTTPTPTTPSSGGGGSSSSSSSSSGGSSSSTSIPSTGTLTPTVPQKPVVTPATTITTTTTTCKATTQLGQLVELFISLGIIKQDKVSSARSYICSLSTSTTNNSQLTTGTTKFTLALDIGARNSEVTALQTYLISQGFLSSKATGYFGQLTKTAVGKFQEKYNLAKPGDSAYGFVGPKTRMKLNEVVK